MSCSVPKLPDLLHAVGTRSRLFHLKGKGFENNQGKTKQSVPCSLELLHKERWRNVVAICLQLGRTTLQETAISILRGINQKNNSIRDMIGHETNCPVMQTREKALAKNDSTRNSSGLDRHTFMRFLGVLLGMHKTYY
ncbi:hypothetical protein GOP47_0016838 [Adiantum capillus-veneris]|uniref:Uncharacterized protein n=1 Tax=Adiantum capillus-veneris TaxID=13818 RepID=A0A9D4UJC4_ADICA|nr:hypothetical protein GOP47_0016838 [Adiantum capillus-veneris]